MKHLCDIRPSDGDPYPVLCGGDSATALASVWRAEWRQAVVLGDTTTSELFGRSIASGLRTRGCEVLELEFPPGEDHKNRATNERLEDAMLSAHIERGACIVAVGGGVPLDVGGFIAATYLRGIAHINVATTLLAQVDAAIGGKTGVNTPHGKNLIGAFHHPRAVLLDVDALGSLPTAELRYGLAECAKHATLRDELLFIELERLADDVRPPSAELIQRSVAVKAAIVSADPFERGERAVLNFGHTVGHALEAATNHALPHGAAIAVGMVIESRLAARRGWLDASDVTRLSTLLTRLGLPVHAPCSFERAAPFFSGDKKTTAGRIRCAIPERIGIVRAYEGSWTRVVTQAELREAWT